MATEIVMPKLGLTMTEGTIDHWLVAVGDQVTAGQPILEISSEKLTSEVESPEAGTVLKLLYVDGDTVPCKQAVAIIGDASEIVDESTAASPAQAPVAESQPVAVNDVSTDEPTKPRSTGRILISVY